LPCRWNRGIEKRQEGKRAKRQEGKEKGEEKEKKGRARSFFVIQVFVNDSKLRNVLILWILRIPGPTKGVETDYYLPLRVVLTNDRWQRFSNTKEKYRNALIS
jgi:hypothetical protein